MHGDVCLAISILQMRTTKGWLVFYEWVQARGQVACSDHVPIKPRFFDIKRETKCSKDTLFCAFEVAQKSFLSGGLPMMHADSACVNPKKCIDSSLFPLMHNNKARCERPINYEERRLLPEKSCFLNVILFVVSPRTHIHLFH